MVLEAYNDVVREFENEPGVVVVDLARSMEKTSAYYYDFLHFTERGAAEVAQIVLEGIGGWRAANSASVSPKGAHHAHGQ